MAFFWMSGSKEPAPRAMNRRALGVTLATLSLAGAGCAANAPVGPPPLPETVVLRVDRVVVTPTKPDTPATWDQSPADTQSAACELVGVALGVASSSPVVGRGAELFCRTQSAGGPAERRSEDPDLALRVSAGTGTPYVSRVAPNVLAETFKYEIAVPTAAIPPDGLLLEVVDDDASSGPEGIGAIRVTRRDVARALADRSGLWVVSARGIERLELVVTPYTPAKLPRTSMAAKEGLHVADTRALHAGEVVALEARGSYTVGTWYDRPIDPLGYPAERARSYNFREEPFQSAPHACAVATVGDTGKVQGVVVRPERTFVAAVPGPLRFGVNDAEPANNHGSLAFEGRTRAATVGEWMWQESAAR